MSTIEYGERYNITIRVDRDSDAYVDIDNVTLSNLVYVGDGIYVLRFTQGYGYGEKEIEVYPGDFTVREVENA